VYKFPECVYKYMTNTWMSQTCAACQEAQICLEGQSDDFLPPQAQDVEIMHVFIQAGYGSQELAALNHCRMYTRDIYLSNICNATGTQLKQNSWNNPTQGVSIYTWSDYPKPTQMEWRGWQQALQQSLSLGHNLTLPLPLGHWFLEVPLIPLVLSCR